MKNDQINKSFQNNSFTKKKKGNCTNSMEKLLQR